VIGLVTRSIVTDSPDTADAVVRSGAAREPEPTTPTEVEVAVRFTRITAVDQSRVLRFILMMEHRRRQIEAQQPSPVAAAAPLLATVPATSRSPAPVAAAAPANAPSPEPSPRPASAAIPTPRRPATSTPPPLDADEPVIAVGLRLCDDGSDVVRKWFDSLMPFDRIELLSQIQANMSGASVAGAAEPSSVRPLAVGLGLLTQ
jgi:hypothetical protein